MRRQASCCYRRALPGCPPACPHVQAIAVLPARLSLAPVPGRHALLPCTAMPASNFFLLPACLPACPCCLLPL